MKSTIKIKYYWVLLLVIPVILFMLSTWRGIKLTNDSISYLYAAESFSETGEFKNTDGLSFSHYPPLYPFVLSFLLNNLQTSMKILNIMCLLGTIGIMSLLAFRWFNNFVVAFQYLLILILGVPLYLIAQFVWSEPVFLLLFSLQLYLLYLYFKKPGLKYLLYLAVISILYCLQRKVGFFFIIGISISIGLNPQNEKKLKHLILYFLISLLYIPIWLLSLNFNTPFSSTLNHTPAFTKVSAFFIEGLGAWIIPPSFSFFFQAMVVSFTFALLVYFFIKTKDRLSFAYFIIFLVYFIIMQVFPYDDFAETERYLSVVYPLFFILLFKVIDWAHQFSSIIPFRKVIIAFVFLWLLYPAVRTIKNISFWHNTSGKYEAFIEINKKER